MAETENTKRIAKNTLMLYFRQILIMLVSLYTVRVVLNVLGAEDYGIYNVVAGVVVLFSFVNNAMASGTQRFLNFHLGKGDNQKVNEVYSASLIIHLFIAVIFLLLAETVGLWFVSCKLNIPSERHNATMIVYQFTIVTTIFSIMKVPYNAVIIAYEKMSFFASISIVEVVLKLGIVFLLKISSIDKLVSYSFLLTCVSVIIFFGFKIYCNKKFEIAHFKKINNLSLAKELLSFSGWSLLGATANVCNTQGTNIVLNLFTNVAVNAAMGIANQVNNAVYSFVSNFQTAFNPQIVKSYAANEKDYLVKLIFRTSKLSFFLLFYIVLPLFLNADYVLTLWLKNVPEYAVNFVKLILIWSLIDSFNGPLFMTVQATGNVRNYQIIISSLVFLNLPLSILALKLGANQYCILYIRIALNCVNTLFRVFYLSRILKTSKLTFFYSVIVRSLAAAGVSFVINLFLTQLFHGFAGLIFSCFTCVIISTLLIYLIGFTKEEKNFILNRIRKI